MAVPVSLCCYFILGSFPSPSALYTILSYNSHAWSAYFVLRPPFFPFFCTFLAPIVAVFFYERFSLYFVASLLLEVKISTPSCVMYFESLPFPPRTILLRIYFLLPYLSPCCPLSTLYAHTHSTSTVFFFLSLSYRFRYKFKFINTDVY